MICSLACVQDNTKDSPAEKQPKHQSGVVGDMPNQQLILQASALQPHHPR